MIQDFEVFVSSQKQKGTVSNPDEPVMDFAKRAVDELLKMQPKEWGGDDKGNLVNIKKKSPLVAAFLSVLNNIKEKITELSGKGKFPRFGDLLILFSGSYSSCTVESTTVRIGTYKRQPNSALWPWASLHSGTGGSKVRILHVELRRRR